MYSFAFCLFIELPSKKEKKQKSDFFLNIKYNNKKKKLHRPGFEPGNTRSQVLNITTRLNDKL